MQLTVENLSVRRGERRVLQDLSFDVGAGEALLVKGRNGSGKTTLLRTLAGFLRAERGTISHDLAGWDQGSSTAPDDPELSQSVHYIGHLNGVKPNQTVSENVLFFAEFLDPAATGSVHEDRVDQALDRFGLLNLGGVPSGYLSAGQTRRLGLARLLCAPRPIWLLDEPTTSLDQRSSKAVSSIIEDHLASGGIVIAATHLGLEVESVSVLELDSAKGHA